MKSHIFALVALVGLSGCGGMNVLDIVPAFDATSQSEEVEAEQAAAIDAAVNEIEVVVPDTLVVDEGDHIFPRSDIVWRGDPPGDRHAQLTAIFEDAARTVVGPSSDTGSGLILTIEVTRFHGLTERARYLIGGNYSIRFEMTLRDPATGAIVAGPRSVKADTRGSGGIRALADDLKGRTEKVVVTERLVQVLDVILYEMQGQDQE